MKKVLPIFLIVLNISILINCPSLDFFGGLAIVIEIVIIISLIISIVKKKCISEISIMVVCLLLWSLILLNFYQIIKYGEFSINMFLPLIFVSLILLPVVETYNAYKKGDLRRFKLCRVLTVIFLIIFILCSILVLLIK